MNGNGKRSHVQDNNVQNDQRKTQKRTSDGTSTLSKPPQIAKKQVQNFQ